MIRLGTLFSGIGAIEQALLRMGEEHQLVFACDNGELELKLLEPHLQNEYDELKKIPRYRITPEESFRLAELTARERIEIDNIADHVTHLPTILDKKRLAISTSNETEATKTFANVQKIILITLIIISHPFYHSHYKCIIIFL